MVAAFTFGMLTGCGSNDKVTETIKIAALNGPTGMAMVQMMDMENKYEITAYQAPTDVAAKMISGEVDMAAVPSNMAAVLYNKTKGEVVAVTPIAMGMLQILANDTEIDEVSQLKGKTIVASGQGGTPEYVLEKVLASEGLTIYEDVQVDWLANHSEVSTKLLSQKGTVAMLPEPFVSTAIAAGKDSNVQSVFDLGSLWEEATGEDLPMGVLVAQKAFVEERSGDLEILLKDLEKSVDFVNKDDGAAEKVVEKGFIGKAEIAKTAIPGCGISYFTGKDGVEKGKRILSTFNKTMFEMDPASIGGKLPDENFYYEPK